LVDNIRALRSNPTRRSSDLDAPVYRIEKRPALRLKQGQWAVIGEGGHVLKRGRDLAQVLRVFDSRKVTVVELGGLDPRTRPHIDVCLKPSLHRHTSHTTAICLYIQRYTA